MTEAGVSGGSEAGAERVPGSGSRGTGRAAAGMGAATALSRGIGFIRILTIAAVLGTTYLGNAYQSSNAVSNIVFELLAAGALSAVLVPTFTNLFERNDTEEVERLTGALLGVALLALGLVVVAGEILAPQIARLLTSGVADSRIASAQQELSVFLLRFMLPQILLYAFGAIAVGVLYAQRRFVVPSLAPIALTVVVVIGMLLFRIQVGPGDPGLILDPRAKYTLALTATLAVLAFVSMPCIAMIRSGVRPRIHIPRSEPVFNALLRLSGWAVFQHSAVGILLGVTIVLGNGVKGGVLAHQVAFVFFMAPYAVLAQPIHTTILPEISLDAANGDSAGFSSAARWAVDSMALLVFPVAALMIALAPPLMRAVAFGNAAGTASVGLLATAVASLAVGLVPYAVFLFFARASYALGNSRLPALVAITSAVFAATAMTIIAPHAHGNARIAVLGLGHTGCYLLASGWLAVVLGRRGNSSMVPLTVVRSLLMSVAIGVATWLISGAIDPHGRIACFLVVGGLSIIGGAAYIVGVRLLGAHITLNPRGWVGNPTIESAHR